jgi:small-conductance mechanosensitive channel
MSSSPPNDTKQTGAPKIILFAAAIMFAALMGFALAGQFELIDRSLAKRVVGSMFGLILMVTGNYLPKVVLPVSARRRNPARAMAAERAAGWIFVLAGLVTIAIWILLPIESVMLTAGLVGLGAFILVGANWVWLLMSGADETVEIPDYEPANDPATSQKRLGLLMILHALLWGFAIFLADSIWGDAVSRWMTIPFIIANSLLAIYAIPKMRSNR